MISAHSYYLGRPKQGEFIFGYSQLDEEQITTGIEKLALALNAVSPVMR
ncbi:MAG: hypothetical protein F6K65_32660 [Moorea sp. SIO3C2]|nr:hypothetical protein [Moorena sp. SIO3C2]